MIGHQRLSPGVEFKEIDRSGYDQQDYSVADTAVFMAGFADKGEDYSVQWVNTQQAFREQYGIPTNEIERYLYNGVVEALERGAFCLVSKLPYENMSKDMFPAFTYRIRKPKDLGQSLSAYVNVLKKQDSSISSLFEITAENGIDSELISMDKLDGYLTDQTQGLAIGQNTIKVVDITRKKYEVNSFSLDFELSDEQGKFKELSSIVERRECLGSVAVFTGAANAIFFQHALSAIEPDPEGGFRINEDTEAGFNPVADMRNRDVTGISSLSDCYMPSLVQVASCDCLDMPMNGFRDNDYTVSRNAVSFFPPVNWLANGMLDSTQFRRVGLVVYRLERDIANDKVIRFVPVEAYTGQLDKTAKDPQSGASDYLCDIVNRESNYIRVFANVKQDSDWKGAVASIVRRQVFPIAGFYEKECEKKIDFQNSITGPLNMVLDRMRDPNQVPLDIVVDAGMSNIAQFVKEFQQDGPPIDASEYPLGKVWTMQKRRANGWAIVLKIYDDFCKMTRRDCMFIADGLRPLVLNGDQKIVRSTNFENSIKNSIIPYVRYMSVLNSSYSAGYCNWFLTQDEYTGDLFWCPPSIKAMGVYSYTDAYAHTWNAPAGLTRGVVRDVVDVSFNPLNDEAGQIYQQAWNYAVSYPINGVVIEGQKTFQLKPTALDRVNVRRLMLYLEKNVVRVARQFLYEGNTEYTRQRFVDAIQPFFEEAQQGDGLLDYAIRCDEELNTQDVIDNNELRCLIGVKPVKAIEWIVINFIITNQSANVEEQLTRG